AYLRGPAKLGGCVTVPSRPFVLQVPLQGEAAGARRTGAKILPDGGTAIGVREQDAGVTVPVEVTGDSLPLRAGVLVDGDLAVGQAVRRILHQPQRHGAVAVLQQDVAAAVPIAVQRAPHIGGGPRVGPVVPGCAG